MLAGRCLSVAPALAIASIALFVVGAAPLAQARAADDGPTTPIVDDFNRSNENPVSQGGLWSMAGIDGAAGLQLANTQLRAPGGATDGTAYRPVPQIGDMEVHATIASGPANGNGVAIFVNLKDVGTTGWDGYGMRLYKQIGGYVWNIYRYDNGAATSLAGWSGTPVQGDRMLLGRAGGQLQAWYYTVSNQIWTLKASASDSTYVNGHIGVKIIDNGYGGVPVLDDFGGTDAVTGPPYQDALPATPVLDHFNRAPEDPLSQSANWGPTTPAGTGDTLEVSGVLARNLDVSFWARSYRTTDYSGYTEAYFTVGAMPGSGQALELFLDLNEVGSAAWDGYRFIVLNTSTDQFIVERVTNGGVTGLGSPVSRNVAAGDRLLARRLGSLLEFWHDSGGVGNWTKVRSETDTTYMTGKIGIGMRGKNGAIENFGGGNIVSDESLLRLYAPELRYHPDELYRADSAALATDLWFEDPYGGDTHANLLNRPDTGGGGSYAVASARHASPLLDLSLNFLVSSSVEPGDFLNQPDFYNDDLFSAATDYFDWVAARPTYRQRAYAHVKTGGPSGEKLVQYWMFYYYNPKNVLGAGKHEGDWEMAQVRLDASNVPVSMSLSQHGEGERCDWGSDVELSGARPVVYVGYESHANYFWPGEHQTPFEPDETSSGGDHEVPALTDLATEPEWYEWDGRWGSSTGLFPSPLSPGEQSPWEDPWNWDAGSCTDPPSLLRRRAENSRSAAEDAPQLPKVVGVKRVTRDRVGKAVRLEYCFRTMPKEPSRRPYAIHVSLDNPKDKLPPLTIPWTVKTRCGVIYHPIRAVKPPYQLRYRVKSQGGTWSRVARLQLP